MPIRFPSIPLGSLALALNLSGRCLLDSWVPGRLHSFAPCVARPFRHLPLKRPGTPYIKIFANPVKSLLTAFPCPESCNFVLKSCNFVLIFSSLNGKVCSFPDGRTHLKGTLIYYFFDEPIATDCRPPPPACPVKLTCLPPLNPARPALPRLSLPPCLVLSACLLLHIHASSRVALLVMPCPAIPLASSLFYSWIA